MKAVSFETIRKMDEFGNEYWLARELAPLLEYKQWRNFLPVIEKAMEACKASKNDVFSHFAEVRKMVGLGLGTSREISDIKLSRYACYLIVQNGDPKKTVIAHGQTYFAIQTRRQELEDEDKFANLSEDDKRLSIRKELAEHNKYLAAAAKVAGVESPLDYAIFQDHGYKGLYGGLSAKEIHAKKGLKKSHKILDYMGSTELAANLFRATQTEEKLRRDNVQGKAQANKTHFDVGKKVRQTISELGGTMPEDLDTPTKGVQQLERARAKIEEKQKSEIDNQPLLIDESLQKE